MADNLVLDLKKAPEAELIPRQVIAHERLCRPFVVDVIAMSKLPPSGGGAGKGPDVNMQNIIGMDAGVHIIGDGSSRVWTGVVSYVEQVRWDTQKNSETTYHLQVVPHLWELSLRRGHRIYQERSLPHIIRDLLAEWHIDASWTIKEGDKKQYPIMEYCCQYDETDLDFLNRLVEEAGIIYHFIEVGEGKVKSAIRFTDKAHEEKKNVSIPFVANPQRTGGKLFATNVNICHKVRPGLFQLGDYNFRRPKEPLFAESEAAPEAEGKRELFQWEPGGFLARTDDPRKGAFDERGADDRSTTTHDKGGVGKQRAQRFLEAARHKKRYIAYETSAQNLVPGCVLQIEDHPHGELDGQDLLTIETMTRVNATGEWSVVSEAVFTDVPYRVPRDTKKPRVRGVQSAIVVGPKGDKEIYTDEFGRVRVRFHWDRDGDWDNTRTCWLRVSQAWAGAQYGMHMIPRIGQEVIVDFLDGNPDQPLVVGRVYTHTQPAAYKLPDHATRSTWQTDTTPNQPNTKSFNEVMFEDKKGEELLLIQAQRNFMSLTKRNETERTGEDRVHVVGKDRLDIVGKVDSLHAKEKHTIQMVKVGNIKDLKIQTKGEPTYKAGKTFIEVKSDKIAFTTGKASMVLDGGKIGIEAASGLRMSADKNFVVQGAMVFINAMPASKLNPKTKWVVHDNVPMPEGHMLNAIKKLYGEEEPEKPPLRIEYEMKVRELGTLAKRMAADGVPDEQTARTVHQKRRDLGVEYKGLTPPKLLEEIHERNIKKYGDKLGPSVDHLRDTKGKSWMEISNTASAPGGQDLKFKNK
jgi:type VI secretion system secreted protein VgrG